MRLLELETTGQFDRSLKPVVQNVRQADPVAEIGGRSRRRRSVVALILAW
jgi:hypothetical protein